MKNEGCGKGDGAQSVKSSERRDSSGEPDAIGGEGRLARVSDRVSRAAKRDWLNKRKQEKRKKKARRY